MLVCHMSELCKVWLRKLTNNKKTALSTLLVTRTVCPTCLTYIAYDVVAFALCSSCFIQVNEKSYILRMGAYRDGVKRKGDKIGMGV